MVGRQMQRFLLFSPCISIAGSCAGDSSPRSACSGALLCGQETTGKQDGEHLLVNKKRQEKSVLNVLLLITFQNIPLIPPRKATR